MLERKRPLPNNGAQKKPAPTPKQAAKPVPKASAPTPRKVATPSQALPKKHRHTGFILATTLSIVLALGLAGLGYFSWSHSQNLLSRNDSLSAQVDELSSALADEQDRPRSTSFFYVENAIDG